MPLLLLLLLPAVTPAQGQHRTFRVPFHTLSGLVLFDAKVSDKPAVTLLDTGANVTVLPK